VTTTNKFFKNQTLRSEILEICKIRSKISKIIKLAQKYSCMEEVQSNNQSIICGATLHF
jgi:hypothetical protein